MKNLDVIVFAEDAKSLKVFLSQFSFPVYCVVSDADCKEVAKSHGSVIIENPKPVMGYFGKNFGIQQAIDAGASDYVWILDENVRLGGDWQEYLSSELPKYAQKYPDMCFRLTSGDSKGHYYRDVIQAFKECQRFPIYTRKWLMVTGGAGLFWDVSAWHQAISFFLTVVADKWWPMGQVRDFPLEFLEVGWEKKDIKANKLEERIKKENEAHLRYSDYSMQVEFLKMAIKLKFQIVEKKTGMTLALKNLNGSLCFQTGRDVIQEYSLDIPKTQVYILEGFAERQSYVS